MRFTRASLLGLFLAIAPLGTIAQNAFATETCNMLSGLTPEQFQTILTHLRNAVEAKIQDPTSDQKEVDGQVQALDLFETLPVETLQSEIDRSCWRLSKDPNTPVSPIIEGLPVLSPVLKTLPSPEDIVAKRQDLTAGGGSLKGLLNAPLDSALGGQLATLVGDGQPATLGTVLGPLLTALLGGGFPNAPGLPMLKGPVARRQIPGAAGLSGLLNAPLDSALGGQLATLLGAGQPATLGSVLELLLTGLLRATKSAASQ
ncbi:hypothetical protein AJ79_07073 [Helicocarpus griseus UAMH5409]|uniref:Uncharacterized protein n=1 Tax=Helicocarpus griseus UAMH5409 TaxID=1447875 RepID=A0A2B7X743_9EURO|nr:hypothetical protein AJ79_07073 [Helicocarpus griseus UAMH5409]